MPLSLPLNTVVLLRWSDGKGMRYLKPETIRCSKYPLKLEVLWIGHMFRTDLLVSYNRNSWIFAGRSSLARSSGHVRLPRTGQQGASFYRLESSFTVYGSDAVPECSAQPFCMHRGGGILKKGKKNWGNYIPNSSQDDLHFCRPLAHSQGKSRNLSTSRRMESSRKIGL